jgi:uncharacterized protein YybS (DUF2232 family)
VTSFRPSIAEEMNQFGKILVFAGLLMAAVGALVWSGVGRGWLGRLPGDINYTKGNFSFHFPIITCLLLSLALTVLMWLFRK